MAITSCKSKKNVVEHNTIEVVSAKKLINKHYNLSFNQQTIDARLNAKYKSKNTSVSISIKMRLEKDKTIWMSATKLNIPVAKILITPTSVQYYEKLDKTYFEGDFSLLSKWLGAELDFKKIQNLLLGEAVLNLKKGKYNIQIINNSYEITPKDSQNLFGILFFINPENYKLDKQEISNPLKEQLMAVSYPNYSEIVGQQFPKKINIQVLDKKKLTLINMEYKSVEFNKELSFPFNIPSGYKKISLK